MNNNLMKVDAYAEEFNRAKEKLHYDQRNLDSLQKLSKFNVIHFSIFEKKTLQLPCLTLLLLG